MSESLAPIHYWLYNKIQVLNERTQMLFKELISINPDRAYELEEEIIQTWGSNDFNTELEKVIDISNIHGWLQRQINIAEMKEAKLVSEMLKKDTADYDKVAYVFIKHAKLCAEQAKKSGKYELTSAPGIYKAVQDYILSGMPCDSVNTLISSSQTYLKWNTAFNIHESNWRQVKGDIKIMNELYQLWLIHFIENLNDEFKINQISSLEFELKK